MTPATERLSAALSDRYRIGRELAAGSGPEDIFAVGTGTDRKRKNVVATFLMLRMAPVIGEHTPPIVVLNWAEEVRRRMVEQGGRTP